MMTCRYSYTGITIISTTYVSKFHLKNDNYYWWANEWGGLAIHGWASGGDLLFKDASEWGNLDGVGE